MKKQRPKNLDLLTIRLPLPGLLSILHRISGAFLFLLLPVALYVFQQSLISEQTFAAVQAVLVLPWVKLILLGMIWLFVHHFCAGIRYLLLDVHIGVDLASARWSSKVVFIAGFVVTLLIGVRVLW